MSDHIPGVTTPPEKYMPEREWEVEDHLTRARTGERPLSREYVEYRNEVLRRAGLGDEIEEAEGGAPTEASSVAEHHEAIRRNR